MFLFREIFNHRRLVFVVNTPFSTETLHVCYFIDPKGVSLVDWCAVYMLRRMNSLLWCLVFNEGVTVQLAGDLHEEDRKHVPFGFSFCIYRHIEAILFDFSRRIEFLGQETDELGFVHLWNYW